MFCPFCKNNETIVKDSRISEDGTAIRRRRYCQKCDSRFTTFERVQFKEVIIIKRNGEKEFFDSEKLARAIRMALRKRPIEIGKVEEIVNYITRKLDSEADIEIPSSMLGELVMESLEKLDKVAFVRFASVYKNFNKAEDFQNFINKLAK
jgi:transcriptional repressor NrdR